MSNYTQRFAAWLLTEPGKTFTSVVAGTSIIGVIALKTLPHTLFLNKYEDLVHLYKNGFPVSLPKEIKDKFEKTLNLLEIPEEDRSLYKPFMVIGFNVFSAGSSYSRFGALIGIPNNFTYKNLDSIDKHAIKFRGESIPWITDEGKLLLQSTLLSENAQLYEIAKEIKMRDNPKFIFDTFYASGSIFLYYALTNRLNNRFSFYTRPLSFRVILYLLAGTFVCGNYFLLKDFTQVYYEQEIDEYLKRKDSIFAEGGKEFYEKMLQRNIAYRKLLGKEGERKYTALGNENYLFRQKHWPLVQRRNFFEEKV